MAPPKLLDTMSLRLNKRNLKLSTVAIAGAAVVAAGFVLITTFPHVKTSFLSVLGLRKDHVPADKPVVDLSEWTDEELKSFLQEVRS